MKRIVFLTGTRADFGKVKSLIQVLENQEDFEVHIFVTGMHMLEEYGYTLIEVERCGFKNINTFNNHTSEATMDLTLAKTIGGFSEFIKTVHPDLIVIHGDRVEALAGAIVGSLNNVLVAHIEGGELSGTIDELIRHSTSKMSHIHFVANDKAKERLEQMGELSKSIYTIGSPDVDIMFSNTLQSIDFVKDYYAIDFEDYAIAMFHPVTTEYEVIEVYVKEFVQALLDSNKNYIVIFPNNDLGSKIIIKAYERLRNNPRFKIFPSIRFEYFLTLLKKAQFIIGNSSAGVREAPYYGVITVNVGTRQANRIVSDSIVNTSYNKESILAGVNSIDTLHISEVKLFGKGNSAESFLESLLLEDFWQTNHQKQFKEI